jgi:hypothetical protein
VKTRQYFGLLIVLATLAGCSFARLYSSVPPAAQATSPAFAALFQPQAAAGQDRFNCFRFVITNTSEKPFAVDWDDSYFLLDGRRRGPFGWVGMKVEDLKQLNRNPVHIVPPGAALAAVIFPVELLAGKPLREGLRLGAGSPDGEAALGPLPEGLNGLELTVNLDGEQVRETLTVKITSRRR